jgi:outer membrane autotransporter protein
LKKALLKTTFSSQFILLTFLLTQLYSQPALSATTNIDSSNISTSSIGDNDTVNFTGGGSLIVDSGKTLESLTTTTPYGNVNFSTANNLTLTNSIGTSSKPLNNISFNANGSLILGGDVYLNNGITTATNNSGNINLNSNNILQKIESTIGTNNYNLKELSINQDKGAIFNKDVNITNLINNGVGSEISGSGNLNFINAEINDNFKISNFGNVNIGGTKLDENGNTVNLGTISIITNKALTINNNTTSLSNLSIADSGKVIINNTKNLNILGNITGANGSINIEDVSKAGDPANSGTLTLFGKITQTIEASIGSSSTSLSNLVNLNVNNVLSSEKPSISDGVVLSNDAYLNNIRFTNITDISKISIATGKSINLLRNIAESSGGSGIITGVGKLILNGTSNQTIDANLGTSNTDRLGELQINSTSKITLNDTSYLEKLTTSKISSLSNNSTLNTNILDVQKSLRISGSGDFEVANLNIANAENLTLENDKTIKITNASTGSGAIKTNNSGTGNIFFSSNGDINVANQIGESNAYLNKIIVNNADGKAVNFNNNVFASSLNFTNSTGQSKIVITNDKTLNISGDVNNLSDSIISGAGTLKLSGVTKEQNIYTKIGASGNSLQELEINNPFGVTLYQDSFVETLTLSNGAIKIAGKTLTINNNLDLANQSFTSKIINDFGKIKSSNLTVANTTNIAFDYSNTNIDLDYAPSSSALALTTPYTIMESTGINGDINLVKISDNSYLFDNILEISGNNIVTKIKVSDNYNEANIGSQNYQTLNNALSSSNLSSKFVRISNKENLNLALISLKPIPIETTINNALNINDTTFSAISTHLKNFDLTTAINNSSDDNSNNKKPKKIELWGQIFGNKLTLKSNDSKQKFDNNNYGGIIGFDHLIKSKDNDILIGSAIAINKSRIFDDLKIHNNNIDSYQIALYNINYSKINEGFYSKNLANLSLNKYKNLRTLKIENYQENLKSNFNGKSYSFESGVGYKFKIIDDFSITPDFAVQYFKLSQDSYKEKSQADSSLAVKGFNYNEFIAKLGVNFAGKFTYSEYEYKPNFAISWDRKLKNNRQLTQSNFVSGGNSNINSLKILQRDKLNLGFGLNLADKNNQRLNLKYDLQLANKFVNNVGFVEYSWEF